MKKDSGSLIRDYKAVFETSAGKKVLKHILGISHYCNTTYTANDPTTMAFREGRRSIVLDILKVLDIEDIATYELIKQLKKEGKNE